MTETDWHSSDDPMGMLTHLGENCCARKLRLFACACARRLSHRLTDLASQTAVVVAEQFADELVSEKDLDRARENAWEAYWHLLGVEQRARELRDEGIGDTALRAAHAAVWSTCRNAWEGCLRTTQATTGAAQASWVGAVTGERKMQAALLRDIFGNPFRRPMARFGSERNAVCLEMAQRIYVRRSFTELPQLGEALMDSGCHDEPLMAHCHQPGEHVRGCWVIDQLLARS